MTLDEAVKSFEDSIRSAGGVCKTGAAMAICETGERYIAINSGGIKEEGERLPALYSSEEAASEAWCSAAMSYFSVKNHPPGTLYWRLRPTMRSEQLLVVGSDPKDFPPHSYYWVTSRLLISDKPSIYNRMLNPNARQDPRQRDEAVVVSYRARAFLITREEREDNLAVQIFSDSLKDLTA